MKRGAVIAIVAGATLLLGAGIAWWALSRAPGPAEVALQFLTALEAGDGDAALALTDDVPDSASRAAEALTGAAALIQDPAVSSVEQGAGAPTRATVTFELDGEPRTVSFGLVERDERWRVAADALASITPTTTLGDSVRLGAMLVAASQPVALLPATYAVTAAPAGVLSGSATAVALPGVDDDVAIEASLAPDATAQAQTQLDAYAQTCTAEASAVPEHCGIRVPWAADLASLTSIAFRIEAGPVVAIAPDARTFAATGGVLVATATGTTRSGATASFTYRAEDWALRGTVTLTGDEMVLHVD